MMKTRTSREVIDEWFHRLWIARDVSAIAELREPSAVSRGLAPDSLPNADAFADFYRAAVRVFVDTQVEILDFICSDAGEGKDRCSMRVRFHAVAGDTQIAFDGVGFCTIHNGRIAEAWNLWDVPTMCAQLGLQGDAPTTIQGVVARLMR
jgi:hypothetical protein